ncbi:MAG: response regulator, partial [Polaromonas sp.]|nr:response regulator [Polaromonas sp.]
QPAQFECTYMLSGRVFELNAFLIDGLAPGMVAVAFNDITQRRQSEHQALAQAKVLADLSYRKDEFLAMLSHELRNPLAAIFYALPLLALQKSDDPMQLRARAIIERQAKQLNHLVDDLLEVSRITTGRVQLRPVPVTVGSIVTRAIETAQPLVTERHHALAVSLPAQPLWLSADAARLEQVVVNLLTNAAKYTNPGGRISLSVVQEGASAVLRVQDNGIGIVPELLPCIFDLFTQAERSLDRSQGGLGIGLCLVQRLVEMHGGTVSASSTPGQGSEFVVRLPMTPAFAAPPRLPPSTSSAPPLAQLATEPAAAALPCRVLVVDDNLDAAHTLGMLLEFLSHDVRMRHDGPGALAEAVAWQPDVVLLDIGLPGLSGHEVARRIRQHPALAAMVLVALTGYGQETDRQSAQEAGFDHHLTKPVAFGEVEKILLAVAESRR